MSPTHWKQCWPVTQTPAQVDEPRGELEEMGCRHISTPQHCHNGLLCHVVQWENAVKLRNDCVMSLLTVAFKCLSAWKLKAPTASNINGLEKPRISYLTTVYPRSLSCHVCSIWETESGNSKEICPLNYTVWATPCKHQCISWLWQLLLVCKTKCVLSEQKT